MQRADIFSADELLWDELEMEQGIHQPNCNCPKCQSEEDEIIGRDDRKRIYSTTKSPFRYICHIEIDRGNGPEPGRTGTLIGPKTVLTAAHCIWDESKNKKEDLSKVKIRVIPGRRGSKEPLPISFASKLIVPAGYTRSKGASRLDYGIIHLKKPIGNTISYWSFNYKKWPKDQRGVSFLKDRLPFSPKSGRLKLNIAGYPVDKPSFDPQQRGTYIYWDYDKAVNLDNGLLYYKNDTYQGHSGSPVWIKRSQWKGGRVLVGIHVAGTSTQNRAVFLSSSVKNFIKRNLK